jgi:hypothetical protein
MEPIPLQGVLNKWAEQMAGCDAIKVHFRPVNARFFGSTAPHARIGYG